MPWHPPGHFSGYGPRAPRPRRLGPYEDYLRKRISACEGLSARRLHREIRSLGYNGHEGADCHVLRVNCYRTGGLIRAPYSPRCDPETGKIREFPSQNTGNIRAESPPQCPREAMKTDTADHPEEHPGHLETTEPHRKIRTGAGHFTEPTHHQPGYGCPRPWRMAQHRGGDPGREGFPFHRPGHRAGYGCGRTLDCSLQWTSSCEAVP